MIKDEQTVLRVCVCIVIRILYLNLYNMPCMRIFLKYNVQWTKYDRIDILLV